LHPIISLVKLYYVIIGHTSDNKTFIAAASPPFHYYHNIA